MQYAKNGSKRCGMVIAVKDVFTNNNNNNDTYFLVLLPSRMAITDGNLLCMACRYEVTFKKSEKGLCHMSRFFEKIYQSINWKFVVNKTVETF